jgi:uncharacterized membrane protein
MMSQNRQKDVRKWIKNDVQKSSKRGPKIDQKWGSKSSKKRFKNRLKMMSQNRQKRGRKLIRNGVRNRQKHSIKSQLFKIGS